jgi:hypothetical protein
VSLRCATLLERHQQQSLTIADRWSQNHLFVRFPPAKTDGGRAACKERSETQQISTQDATLLPPPHFACNAAHTIAQDRGSQDHLSVLSTSQD